MAISVQIVVNVDPEVVIIAESNKYLQTRGRHCYRINERPGQNIDHFFRAEGLLQEHVCIASASVESQRLSFARFNQDILRSEVLSFLNDAFLHPIQILVKLVEELSALNLFAK